MTYLNIILLFFKNIIFLNPLVTKLVCSLIILYTLFKVLKSKILLKKDVSLHAYKITNFTYTFFTLFAYIIIILILLFFYRLANIFCEVNLKIISLNLVSYISENKFVIIITDAIFFTLLIISLLILLLLIKNCFVKEFNKIHIYFCDSNNSYLDIFYIEICCKASMKLYDLDFMEKYISVPITYKWKQYYKKFIDNLGLIIILIVFIYDLIFNNFVITKVYLILPVVYLYLQFILYMKFMPKRDISLDQRLNTLYYEEIIARDNNNVFFNHGIVYNNEDLLCLQQHILRNFKLESLTRTHIVNIVNNNNK